MDDKVVQMLTALAQKLGTTVEFLWAVILRQAPITAATEIATFLLAVVAVGLWHRHVRRKMAKDPGTGSSEWDCDDDASPPIIWATVLLPWAMLIGAGCQLAPMWVAAFLNPEYVALHEVLRQVR